MEEENSQMKTTILLQALIYAIFGISNSFAEDIRQTNIIFNFKFFKDDTVIHEGYLSSTKSLVYEDGKEQGLLTYQCQKNQDGQSNILNVGMTKINDFMILKCDDMMNKIVNCTVEFHNATYDNQLAKKEFSNKTCNEVHPKKYIKQFNFILKHLEDQQILLQDGYKLEYSLTN